MTLSTYFTCFGMACLIRIRIGVNGVFFIRPPVVGVRPNLVLLIVHNIVCITITIVNNDQ